MDSNGDDEQMPELVQGPPPLPEPTIIYKYGAMEGKTYGTFRARNMQEAAAEYRLYKQHTQDLIAMRCPKWFVASLAEQAIKEERAIQEFYTEWCARQVSARRSPDDNTLF